MADRRSTVSNPSSRSCADRSARGFTFVELLVVLTVAGVVMGATLTLTLSTREGYEADQGRTDVNQNLRTALDLLGVELRQAGERLPGDVPALEIVNGDDGAPDRLILRRNLLSEVLPLCGTIVQDTVTDELKVADAADPAPGCLVQDDVNANGWPDNIDLWRGYRDAQGGSVRAYVYNPVTRLGEYFDFDNDNTTDATFLGKGNDDPWVNGYGVDELCRVYILEEREYLLDEGLLQFRLNDDDDTVINVARGVTGFQLLGHMTDDTVVEELLAVDDWTNLRSVEVALAGEGDGGGDLVISRSVSARFFPRNILSN